MQFSHLHLLVTHHTHPIGGARGELTTRFAHAQLADATWRSAIRDAPQFGVATRTMPIRFGMQQWIMATNVTCACCCCICCDCCCRHIVIVQFVLLLLLLLLVILLQWILWILLCGIKWAAHAQSALPTQRIQFGTQKPVVSLIRMNACICVCAFHFCFVQACVCLNAGERIIHILYV